MSVKKVARPGIAQRKKARNLLVQALYQWQLSGGQADAIEKEYRADNGRKTDWDFFHNALKAILAKPEAFDELFVPFLDRELEKLNPIELAILRLGCFELKNCIDVPYKVVINEGVELAKKYGASESHKYINGVLDKAARKLRSAELNAPS